MDAENAGGSLGLGEQGSTRAFMMRPSFPCAPVPPRWRLGSRDPDRLSSRSTNVELGVDRAQAIGEGGAAGLLGMDKTVEDAVNHILGLSNSDENIEVGLDAEDTHDTTSLLLISVPCCVVFHVLRRNSTTG